MDYYDQIEAYLSESLSASDKAAFERAMDEDAGLKQAVADHGVAMDIVGGILEDEIRQVIQHEEERHKGQESSADGNRTEPSTKSNTLRWMRWAAAAVVVLALGWWGQTEYTLRQQKVRMNIALTLYSKPSSDGVRGNEDLKDLEEKAIKAFNLNRYEEARVLFTELGNNEEHKGLSSFYLGHISFLENDYEESIKHLNLSKRSGYRVDEANQILVFNYFILRMDSEILELQNETENLIIPLLD